MLACMVPTLIGFAALSYDTFQRERTNLHDAAQRMAQALQMSVDRDLDTAETAARALASSPNLASGDLAAFHAQARSVLRPELPAVAFVLSDAAGKPLLDTRVAFGRALTPNSNADNVRKAFLSADVITSDLSHGPDGGYATSVDVPVLRDGEVIYVLSAQLSAARMSSLIADLSLPKDWAASIVDASYTIVARTLQPDKYVGRKAHPLLADAISRTPQGVVELNIRPGFTVLSVFSRSRERGWSATIGVPRDAAYQALRGSLSNVFLSVAALLMIGFVTAWSIGGMIGRAVRALSAPAVALGKGEPVLVPRLEIREAAEVGEALKQVEAELTRYRSGLEELVRERTSELERMNALIETVYATAPAGMAVLDLDLRVIMVNDYLAAINDKPVSEHLGRTLPEILGQQGVEFEKAYRYVRDTGQPLVAVEGRGEVPREPGIEHHWVVSYHPVFDHEHKMLGISAVVLDVSERKVLSDQLRDVNAQFHALYEMSGDAHMLVTLNAGFISGNKAAARIFGCQTVEEFMLLSPATTSPEFQPDGRRSAEKAEQFMRYTLETGSHQFEWVHRRVDGTLFHADILLTSLNMGGKGVIQATVRDISERIDAEQRLHSLNEQLTHALDRAEMASSAKSEFLANMSHEIRTPMNAIMGLARLLDESPLGRRERSFVAKIKTSTRSLLGILNDVLDFSKIEAGQLMLEYTAFGIDQVLGSISVLLAPNAVAKGLELVFVVEPDLPSELVGDSMRLEQVLLNLVSNAIKFTEKGEVVLSIRKLSETEDSMALGFSVRDTGIGIAAAHHTHMFDPFSQGDSSTSRKYGGTGLGLTICRRLVGLMGGTIGVASELGKGADFHFDSSFGLVPGGAAVTLPKLPHLAGCHVLVADDNPTSCAAIAAQCRWYGWHVDCASGGAQSLEMLRTATATGRPYDFLFLDVGMPDLDGISVLTYARADRSISLPRCALMVSEKSREKLMGVTDGLAYDAILSKPVTRDALVAAVLEMHSGQSQAGAGPARPLAGQLDGIYVLLVEDNQINQEVANYLLLHAGAAVDIAANGEIAVRMLGDAPTRYDAVLMDIQMPVMNGYEATEGIRNMGLSDLPIIAMTANVMEDDRARAIEAGMNAHISKPIDVDVMVATLIRLTSGGDLRDLQQSERASYGYSAPVLDLPQDTEIAGIDLRSTLPRFGGSFANFVTLFKRFERSQGNTLNEVRELLHADQRDAALALVHRLRGVAANLGASVFAANALDFEHALRVAVQADVLARLDQLENELAMLMVAARKLDMPAAGAAPAAGADSRTVEHGLADLLGLLQNNNLKALAEFESMRAGLDAALAPQEVSALSDAIATLAFSSAAAQVHALLNRKVTQ
ncbi:MAG: response regulator [Pseudomonadota bacterium]